MSDSLERTDQLRDALNEWLVGEFASLDGDALYMALSDVLTGGSSGGDATAKRFVVWARGLIAEQFGDLSPAARSAALGAVAQGIVEARQRRRSASVSESRPLSTSEASPVLVEGDRAVGNHAFVRFPEFTMVQVWTAPSARVTLTFEEEESLLAFADVFCREHAIGLELSPAPEALSALEVELLSPGLEPIRMLAGAARVGPGDHVLVAAQELPPMLRRMAARRRARLSSSHVAVPGRADAEVATMPPVGRPSVVASASVQAVPRERSASMSEEHEAADDGVAERRRLRAAARSAETSQPPRAASRTRSTEDVRTRPAPPTSGSGRSPSRRSASMSRSVPVVSMDDEPESFPTISEGDARSLSESGVWISTPTSPSSAALLEALPEGVEPLAPRAYSSGERVEGGAAEVLLRAAAEHPVAVVSIRTSVRRWQLTLREDALIGVTARPEDSRFTFRNALATSGMVSPEQMEEASEAARAHGVTLRDVLVARRMLRYRDLEALDRTRATYALTLLLSEAVERWEVHGFGALRGAPPSIAPFAHRAWDELHQGVTQRETAALESAMAPRMLHRPVLRTDRFIDLRSMQLDPRDARVATEVLDGTTSVARAIAGSQLSRRAVLALVLSLDMVGMWRWTEVRATQSRIARAWDAIVSKHDALTRSNPFDLLGTHWSSDDALVDEAYTHLLHTLDLDYVIAEGTPEEAEVAKRVREGLTVARETLKHSDARTAVRRSISSESERKSALSLYDQRAEMAMMRGEHSAAVESLRRVLELNPEHATARRALQEARLRGER